jgi:hypothetical protein
MEYKSINLMEYKSINLMELSNIVDTWRYNKTDIIATVTTKFGNPVSGKVSFKAFPAPPHIQGASNPSISIANEDIALMSIKTIEFDNCCYTIEE